DTGGGSSHERDWRLKIGSGLGAHTCSFAGGPGRVTVISGIDRPVCIFHFRSGQAPASQGSAPMPMIDVYATGGTFVNPKALARDLASTLMKIEQVPDIPMFRRNTAAFIHDLPDGALSNVEGDGNYVRVQVLTNAGALNRDKQL